jgi:hypothetical protein
MKDACVMLIVVFVFLLMVGAAWHLGRSTKPCPQPYVPPDSTAYYRQKSDSIAMVMDMILYAAQQAHDDHVREINNRPTQNQRFNEVFTHSPNADSALAKWRNVLLQRPSGYDYRADSITGHVYAVDTLR